MSYKVTKDKVVHNCSVCGVDLENSLAEAGQKDVCPKCGNPFEVPGGKELQEVMTRRQIEAQKKTERIEAERIEAERRIRERTESRLRDAKIEAEARQRAVAEQSAQRERESERNVTNSHAENHTPSTLALGQNRKSFISLEAVLMLIIALVLSYGVYEFWEWKNIPPAVNNQPIDKWEYKIEDVSDTLFDMEMKSYGDQGWELVFARRATSPGGASVSYEIIFKRRKKDV